MYPLGLLFGLGFDTATEVGLLGIAAIEAGKGLPIFAILIFPLLFTAGMSLIDTTDGILMLGAYGWAFVKPVRKLYYNMNITLVSVLVALLVGTIEALSVVVDQLKLTGPLWDRLSATSATTSVCSASRSSAIFVGKLGRFDGRLQAAPLRRSGAENSG